MTDRVIGVIVTYNRKDLLRQCLDAVLSQSYPLAEILVVNNASTDATREMLEKEYAGRINRIHMEHNVGGAGGFYRGMTWAHDNGADWMWLMDDDGVPDATALENLMAPANRQAWDLMNSLVIDRTDNTRLSFGLVINGRHVWSVPELLSAINGAPAVKGQINPFNGTLISRRIIDKVGYTKREMFVWGDEVDYMRRLRAFGANYGTILAARHFHPPPKESVDDLGPFGTIEIWPPARKKIAARNMGYRIRKERPVWYWFAKPAIYVVYFMLKNGWAETRDFVSYYIDGFFDRYKLSPSREELIGKSEQFTFIPVTRA